MRSFLGRAHQQRSVLEVPDAPRSGSPGFAAVVAQDVAKSFLSVGGEVVDALAPTCLTIGEGEFVSIVGPSGCGKTTLLRMIAGIETASSGMIEVGGRQVRGPRRDVGVVFQRPELLEWRTVRSNVLLPAEVQRRPIADAEARADGLLEISGLTAFAQSYPHELSGGMQQRVAIARALVIEPRVLLLDEPFGALDALTRERMNVHLAEVCERQRISTLLITHSYDEAVLLSDRVVVLSDRPGSIIGEVAVDLPRPRNVATLGLPEFLEKVHQVRMCLGRGSPAPAGHLDLITSAPEAVG